MTSGEGGQLVALSVVYDALWRPGFDNTFWKTLE